MVTSSDSADDLARNAAVGDFVESWTADRQRGCERPLADYLARFPGHEAAIAREYANLVEPLPALAALPADIAAFAPYRPIRLLGHGGQGEVWLADDPRLGRQVALKVLTAPAPVMAGRVERLRREAQALARLAHPGICAIHEACLDGPRPWLAMQYVEGVTLAAVLAARDTGRSGIERHELAGWIEFFAAAASALQAAHALGILHRDIKPGNLMRTPAGAPVLLDFGLARDLEADAIALTQSGEMFGTLPYMAPEVLAGRPADHRADIYALAVTSYELLAGRRPFAGATQAALRQAIEAGDPTALDRAAPGVGRDLAVVVATAMERDPARRYASAAALAADLRAVLAGEAIAAVPPGRWLRIRRLMARHPALASSFGLLVAGLLVAMVLLAQLTRERTRLLALRQAHIARQIGATQPGLALFAASEAARTERHPEINEVLYQVLDQCFEEHAVYAEPLPRTVEAGAVAITEDDRQLVRAVSGALIQVVDLATGCARTLVDLDADGALVVLAAGDALVVGADDGIVRQLDLHSGAELRSWPLHTGSVGGAVAVTHLCRAPDRRRIASAGADGLVAVFALDGGDPVSCRGHVGLVSMMVFTPDGSRLVTLGGKRNGFPDGDRCVRVFATDTGELLHTFGPFAAAPHWVAWSGSGTALAIGSDADGVVVHDLERGGERSLPHPAPVRWVEFTPGDGGIVFASMRGLHVVDRVTGELLAYHDDFQGRSVFRGAFSPDRGQLAVIAWDDTARVYDTRLWLPQRVFRGVMTRPLELAWNRRGDRLYTVGGCLQSWYVGPRPFLPVASGLGGKLVSARFSPSGEQIVAANEAGEIRTWDAVRCEPLGTRQSGLPLRDVLHCGHDDRLLLLTADQPARLLTAGGDVVLLGDVPAAAGFRLGTDRVVLASTDGRVRVHDATSGRELHSVRCHDGAIVTALLHHDRPWLATGGQDRSLRVVDVERGRLLYESGPVPAPAPAVGARNRVLGLAFAPTESRLWVASEDQWVRGVDLVGGGTLAEFRSGPTSGPLLVSADGRSLFVGAIWSGKLNRFATSDCSHQVAHPARHSNMLIALQLQPGGRLALSASRDGLVSVFDSDRDELISVIHAAKGTLAAACFAPDGRSLLTAESSGEVRVWPLDPLAVALRHRPARTAMQIEDR